MPASHINTREIYDKYCKLDIPNKVDTYKEFMEIVHEFMKGISISIIKGNSFTMHPQIGQFEIIQVERKGSANNYGDINWPASKENKKKLIEQGIEIKTKDNPEGKEWFVYYTSPTYCRWNWFRNKNILHYFPNLKFYSFKRSWGNKQELSKELKSNPTRILSYELY